VIADSLPGEEQGRDGNAECTGCMSFAGLLEGFEVAAGQPLVGETRPEGRSVVQVELLLQLRIARPD
jgi:hypothetical protein